MDFRTDLKTIIRDYFASEGITDSDAGDASDFAMRYCEMQNRLIQTRPRKVYLSNEIHDSLGNLARENDVVNKSKALEAWNTVFYLRSLMEQGGDVVPHLSTRVKNSSNQDWMLWDYAIHHFHLTRSIEASGFVKRSDYLLFAIVVEDAAFFLDVRPHRDQEGLLWVRQDLLDIIIANWPELFQSNTLQGITGDVLTDEQKKVLRAKNINVIAQPGDEPVAPLGGGVVSSGDSLLCRVWADKLMWEIDRHEAYIRSGSKELERGLESSGIDVSVGMDFKLMLLDSLELGDDVIEHLRQDNCLSSGLAKMGFAVVEASTLKPIAVIIDNTSHIRVKGA